jgi:hypothetical protein
MRITAIAVFCLRHGVLLVFGAPCQLRLLAGQPKDFISNDLVASTTPIEFVPLRGHGYQGRAFGYRATLLPGGSVGFIKTR